MQSTGLFTFLTMTFFALGVMTFTTGSSGQVSRSMVTPVEDKIIHLSVAVPVAPQRAFAYFTDKKLIQSWLAPVAEVEPKVGGRYELFWEPADRENNSTIGCRITAIEAGQFLSFQWRSPKQFKSFANNADPLTHVVVFFVPEEQGTRIHLIHSGWRSTGEWEEARQWQERAWTRAFDELQHRASQ